MFVHTEEIERITQSKGRIFSLHDEPGVYRVWLPNEERQRGPGLAISRAFGDYYIKGFGLISEPEVTQRRITCRDQFAILATDGVRFYQHNSKLYVIAQYATFIIDLF